jgi:hypothetical protein
MNSDGIGTGSMTSEIADPLMEAGEKTALAITPNECESILQALRTGVVPKVGLRQLHVGRSREIGEMVKDVGRIADGGASLRFIIGEYGSGKTFFLGLIRRIALDHGLVVISADLTPARRVYGSDGEARLLVQELIRNLATGAKPEGGALGDVVEGFIASALREAGPAGYSGEKALRKRLAPLEEHPSGSDFAATVTHFARAQGEGDEAGKVAALAWLRAEYVTRADARSALGVQDIIDDSRVFDYLKLLARFVRLAGYGGLLVMLDEMGNLHKLTNPQARAANYEQLLHVLNDVLQGGASHFGIVMAGTPEFLEDTRRGLYSHPALQSRLAENRFARDGLVDVSGPVLRLQQLSREDFRILLSKIRYIFASADPAREFLPDAAVVAFMEHCSRKIGDAYFRTPRSTITAFVHLLSVLEQNPGTTWRDVVGKIEIDPDGTRNPPTRGFPPPGVMPATVADDELASFRL